MAEPSRMTIGIAGLVLALMLAASALALPGRRLGGDPRGGFELSSAGAVRIEDSRGEGAILRVRALAPGASAAGTVAIRNGGSGGRLLLSQSRLTASPGAGGASLVTALRLRIWNITGARPRRIYSGPVAAMPALQLGRLPAGAQHRYRFVVALPEPGFVDLGLMGARVRFDYRWRLVPPR